MSLSGVEIRKAKAELHKDIVETVLSFGGDLYDDAILYKYIIELASNELLACVLPCKYDDEPKKGLDNEGY